MGSNPLGADPEQDKSTPMRVLILASGSSSRIAALRAVGLSFEAIPAKVDEAALRNVWRAKDPQISPAAIAVGLARAKAEEVSRRVPDALVIGGDQVLALAKETISKATSKDSARATLSKLRGREHQLHSAVALAINGQADWDASDTATLQMRAYSDAFLDTYLETAGDALTTSAGAYRIEEQGLQLFDRVDGNHFTILGLPMLALLAELRRRGVLAV
jgi:septum formation protein